MNKLQMVYVASFLSSILAAFIGPSEAMNFMAITTVVALIIESAITVFVDKFKGGK